MKQYIGTEFESFILPAIPPGAPISQYSGIDAAQTGKIPGRLTPDGWTGFSKWSEYTATANDLKIWSNWQPNTSINCKDQLVGLDIDAEDDNFMRVVESTIAIYIGSGLPCRTRTNSIRKIFICAGNVRKRAIKFVNESTGEIVGVDILGNGSQFVIHGEHPSGGTYACDLEDYTFADLVVVDNDVIDRFMDELIKKLAAHRWVVKSGIGTVIHGEFAPQEADVQTYSQREERVDVDKLKAVIPSDVMVKIKQGLPKGERSEAVASVISNLIGLGLDDNVIADILLNPSHGISSKCIDQGEDWTMRDIARMRGKFQPVETKSAPNESVEELSELTEDAILARIKSLDDDCKSDDIDAICADLAKLKNTLAQNTLLKALKKQSGIAIGELRKAIGNHAKRDSGNPAHGSEGDETELVGGSGEVTHHQLAMRHVNNTREHNIDEVMCGGSLYRLNDDFIWEPRPTAKIITEMCSYMDGEDAFTRRSDYNSVQKQYMDIIADEEFFAQRPHGIAYEDSYFYTVEDGKMACVPLEAKHRQTVKGRFSPDESRKPELMLEFLSQVLDNGDLEGQMQQMREMYAMMLLGYMNHMQMCPLFYGAPATGKSVLNNLLCSPFAKQSITAVQPHDFGNEYYAIALKDALVNQITELEAEKSWGEKFKSIVDLSPITGRHPAGRPVSFISYATMLINTNSLPQLRDKTSAAARRMLPFEFINKIAPEDRDPNLERKLQADVPYYMYYCLEVADEVLARGRIFESETCKRIRGQTEERSNNVLDFLADEDVITRNDHMVIPTKTLYEIYKGRCRNNGVKPFGKHNFLSILRDKADCGRTKHDTHNPSGSECLRGWELTPSSWVDCGVNSFDLPAPFTTLKKHTG